MNFRSWPARGGFFLAWWLCAVVFAHAQDKQIRLRNERITTSPPDRAQVFRAAQAPAPPVSGLFLVQFTDRFDPAWRPMLAALRVDLVRYVPDDAFVARLREVRLEELRALPFVQWVGEFRPEHKIHNRVREVLRAAPAGSVAEVVVLCSPMAAPAEMAEARARLVQAGQQSRNRFGAVLRGRLAAGQLQGLAESTAVLWVEPAPRMKLNDEISTKIVAGDSPGHPAHVHQLGFTGAGVVVAVVDSGLHMGDAEEMHPDLAGRTPAFFAYGGLPDASDEHAHGTHVAGIIAGNGSLGTLDEEGYLYGLGVAPGASIITQRIFDGAGGFTFIGETNTFDRLTRDAVQAGAVIGNNSWGDDTAGRYDVSAYEFDALVRDADWDTPGDQPYILEFSAGNAGPRPQSIGTPAVAKNVIASGASQNDRLEFIYYAEGSEAMADFSSRGPCEDGRIKPDVVAPGTWIASLRSPVADDGNSWAEIDFDYLYMGGTSQSGPQVSGAAAVFVQYYKEFNGQDTPPSPALVKAALIHSAVDMDDSVETDPAPNMDEGWGRIDLTELIGHPSRGHEYLDQTVLLATGQFHEQSVLLASTNEPLKITLVYTDVPGFPGAIPALVNDLNLEVIAPDGRIYRGNQFFHGESVPDSIGADNINNIEGVYISDPQAGEYLVRVRAVNVVQDARNDTPGVVDQDFALVASGDIIRTLERGIVLLDRTAYTAPSQIRIKLFDLDLAGMNTSTVTVFSATEPAGQRVTLRATAPNSVSFTGTIATATSATAPAAGRLRIAHGNWIRVDYFDQSELVTTSANAVADLQPPVISNVSVTNQFGQTLVRWTTDEPANSVVRYDTSTALSRGVTNNFRTLGHEMELRNLIPGQTYYFVVISTDAAGNTTTNRNGAVPYEFVAPQAAAVLLVDAYEPTDFDRTLIPLSTYTGPLDQIGVSYDIWHAPTIGMPLYSDLSPYRVVMWRVNDSFWSSDTVPFAQQAAIQQYLNNGGSFFLASMDILTRLLDQSSGANFITNVLRVRRYDRTDPFCFCHCEDCDEDFRVPAAEGVGGDVIGDGFTAALDYSAYPDDFVDIGLGPDFADTFGVATNASPILVEQISRKACGMRYPRTGEDSTGRVVFVSFPLDAIPESGPSPNNRTDFLRRALQFLSPGLNGIGSVAFSQSAYRLPDQLTIEVGDSDLAGSAGAVVQVSSTTQSTPITIPLTETPQSGLFRGFLPLVWATNPPVAGRLRAAPGDTLIAQYNDASGQGIIQATATVDADAVTISDVEAEPQYQDAVIYWETSEPADALVQFGESALLSRTAFASDLETSHAVQLTGLIPDRTYYYRVISRDAAGNATEDPVSDSNLRTFRTLKPITPPFCDNLQNGTNWSVFNGEETQFQWELGSPNNGHVSFTPSGDAMAWASSLQGLAADYVDTFLISPAFDLNGGNVARLKFQHAYDFGEDIGIDLINGGELLIITNSVSAPATLATYFGATPGNAPWELEEFDLTPYLGNVVFLVWHHQLFSIDVARRPGWVIDDICVLVSNIPPGRITVSNHLAQARVVLTGPVGRSGQGYWNDFTNLPPGRYVVTWQAVPYYTTPQPQTVDLATDGLVELAGNYTFPDTNGNGISDTWEQAFFGGLQPVRNCDTDADGDGFSDCAEFIAGTNPTNALSLLRLALPTQFYQGGFPKLRFQWPSTPGRIYQLQALRRDDSGIWDPHSAWIQATSGTTSANISAPDQSEPIIFRVEVKP